MIEIILNLFIIYIQINIFILKQTACPDRGFLV
nr:MAG TPA: hypothetical protein [Caudoviricetes sp.]DAK27632.1 MAG TPA: hypothetical protein [Caudoviricetes sp.]DAS24189.1 MAG TPA: hypothetical protein [Caudoviricetes sp.]DAU85143.1 MAG TPA: hypothetical protein [Caudoviricetes sp.]DAX45440.1 MAG TPA: hypothetical protein [Caudoviricetes sp.]